MATTINPRMTVGELVTQRPSRSRIFEKLGIDYCCGGKRPLEEVCREKGLDAGTVLHVMEAAEQVGGSVDEQTRWDQAPLIQLCDHIQATHHQYLRDELPRLEQITRKVAHAHGSRHPEVLEVAEVFAAFQAEIESHMHKEEQILFPMIRQLDAAVQAGQSPPSFHCGRLANPIGVMEHEHDIAGDAMAKMRRLTGDYSVPSDACNTYRAMVDGLAELENNMHQHVHKENNILFPRAIAMEDKVAL